MHRSCVLKVQKFSISNTSRYMVIFKVHYILNAKVRSFIKKAAQ